VLPFVLFLGFAFLSVGWSAMKGFSLGQALGLLVTLLLTILLGILADTPARLSRSLFHLSLGLLLVSFILVSVDLARHDLSGLDRSAGEEDGPNGMVHPTSAGATSSLGLVILFMANVLWDWPWARKMLLPGLPIHGWLLLQAASRMAWVMTAVVLALLVLFFLRRYLLLVGLLAGSVLGGLYLAADPQLDQLHRAFRIASAKFARDESSESMSSLTGRTALWDAVWVSYYESPWIGHGYFMLTRTGLIDVWSGPSLRTAHNVFLQVLVTTGVVGCALFLWALGQLIVTLTHGLWGSQHLPVAAFLFLMLVWYGGWTQLCESFMGPLQPEVVVFFSVLGLGLGQVPSKGD
jgi:O-antigen ligase